MTQYGMSSECVVNSTLPSSCKMHGFKGHLKSCSSEASGAVLSASGRLRTRRSKICLDIDDDQKPCFSGRFESIAHRSLTKLKAQVINKDWSQRLLSIAKKKKDSELSDVFQPKRSANHDMLLDEDDEEDTSTSEKRLPAEMRCFDTARICVKGGDGGNGCVAFRREKAVEFGGPAGGNGGRGGNVWAIVDSKLNSLSSFRTQVHFRASNGGHGQGSQMHGAEAEDLYIPVPPGTIIRQRNAVEGEAPLAELVQPGDKALLIVGGRGGRGNHSFKTARNTAPTLAEKGEEGVEVWVDLELKVVADVGIIGVPNAGKSTLLSVVTAARPKIANYPFTTLVPNLGVCEMDYRTTVFADVPGLLEGAHEGLGLGHEFLRHVQRCRALVHVIDGSSPDPMGDFRAINLELELFNPELKEKVQVIAYNKVDMPDSGDYFEFVKEELLTQGISADHIFPISAVTGQGVLDLVKKVRKVLDELGPAQQVYETNAVNQTRLPGRQNERLDEFTIDIEEPKGPSGPKVFYVMGKALQKFAQMTNWDYYEAIKRFQSVLEAAGVNSALRARGVKEGDAVVIHESEFTWNDDQSDAALYQAFKDDMRSRNRNIQGIHAWPKGAKDEK
ncbi:hypothetical protein CEUSTIGMA_g11330.t1 [Chlamydomonas eustigma]|uniref:Obg family GTPase CgtA n=1 Tax=Chlamydomonas eustigma TaxID=1157962 RepID=A0A250XLJ6_9CHLO|nr:hypothetical protein CEUSTIGMA_g11330.t1 [Chlamydomonas eustigma]|eukprot:GAX83906.1 hypothetical protein CEUSTIGMA_g11330.t1 [Chlamydomonas eustigma]